MMSSAIAAAATKIAARSSFRFSRLNLAQVQQLHSSQRPSGGKHSASDLHQLLSKEDETMYSDLAYYTELAYCLSAVPYSEPLPRTIQDALRRSNRAIVITESVKPFRIVNVNKAWEDLCGYSYLEAKDKTLGSLLRGPETDTLTGNAMFARLSRGEEVVATLTNYTKDYRAFRHRLQVGPLMNGSNVTHFVGVLQEV